MRYELEKNIESVPTYCCIAILESCFMHCKMCYKWQEDVLIRKPDEPTLEEWKQAISDLAQLCKEQKPQINFAGGEPLAREEIFELIAYAQNLGFPALLASNAYLVDEVKAQKIAQAQLKGISISLDGVTPQTHDLMRGVFGAHEKVLQSIDLIRRYSPGTKITLNCCICALNIHELPDLVQWANNDGRIDGIFFQAVTQPFSTPEEEYWYKNDKYSDLWPLDTLKTNEILEKMYLLKSKGDFKAPFQILNPASQFRAFKHYFSDPEKFIKKGRCHLDNSAINITPAGEVHLCFSMPAIGNIKHQSIQTMWHSKHAEEVRSQIKQCKKNCQALVNCNFDDKQDYID
ncbi:MAG: radical SAM protein [Candidatus Omnitrophica bacterium]|nr:radical SAM protein [Candidatus Omnitrophota bacterium]